MAINIVEVTWKSRLKMAFPNPNDYSEFMGTFSSATGAVTLTMMLISQRIFYADNSHEYQLGLRDKGISTISIFYTISRLTPVFR